MIKLTIALIKETTQVVPAIARVHPKAASLSKVCVNFSNRGPITWKFTVDPALATLV
jgi:hypothetical protein